MGQDMVPESAACSPYLIASTGLLSLGAQGVTMLTSPWFLLHSGTSSCGVVTGLLLEALTYQSFRVLFMCGHFILDLG